MGVYCKPFGMKKRNYTPKNNSGLHCQKSVPLHRGRMNEKKKCAFFKDIFRISILHLL